MRSGGDDACRGRGAMKLFASLSGLMQVRKGNSERRGRRRRERERAREREREQESSRRVTGESKPMRTAAAMPLVVARGG
jgi:hypothetical protein